MKLLVAVKRVVDYNVKVRVKAGNSSVNIAKVKMSMNVNIINSLARDVPMSVTFRGVVR